jgi:hypothetical protein
MALAKLQGFSLPAAGQNFSPETVQAVTDLLNGGEVSVTDVASHFKLSPSVVIQGLTGLSPDGYTNETLTQSDGDAMNKLVSAGVASVQDVANFYSAPESVVEETFTRSYGYTPAQMSNARQGVNINATSDSTDFGTTDQEDNPNTGLKGSEGALTGGVAAAINALNASNVQNSNMLRDQYNQGLATATTQNEIAQRTIRDSTTEGINALNASEVEAQRNLNTNYQSGLDSAVAQSGIARQDISDSFGRAEGMFDPYREAGTNALSMQQALSGSLGQEAFDKAYNESPQMAFLREQGMRANLAGASATGGLGGGNVQKELNRFGQGLASQGLQQQIGNLNTLSGQGLQATDRAAGTATTGGSNLANIASGLGTQTLTTKANLGNNLSNINLTGGNNEMQALTTSGANRANLASALGGQALGTQTGLGNNLFQNNANTANLVSTLNNNLGTNLASGRTNAGNRIADLETNTANNLADSYNNQASNENNVINAQREMLVELVDSGFINEAAAQTRFGEYIANLEMSRGSAVNNVPFTPFANPNYSQGIGNAFDAASAGYDLAGGGNNAGNDGQTFSPVEQPDIRKIFG